MSFETPMKTTISLILFSLLTMTLLISTVFSSEIGTANAQKYSVIATIPVGGNPSGVAVDPINGLVYVADSNTVSVISPATNTIVAYQYIVLGSDPVGVAVDPTNGFLYVSMAVPGTVYVVNPATNTVVANVLVGSVSPGSSGVAINPTNGLVYVTNVRSNTVSVISTVS
jgi:YVTN family beta-propeller protein